MRRLAALALALVMTGACKGSPDARPKVKAHATTTTSSTATSSSTTTTSTSSTTTSTQSALAKPCAATDLGFESIGGSGASQHLLTTVELENTSGFVCSLSGFPTSLTATDQAGKPLEHFDQGTYAPDPPAGNVAPGQSGVVILDTPTVCADQSTPPARTFRNIHIGLPGGGEVSLGDFVVNGACGVAVSKLGVRPNS